MLRQLSIFFLLAVLSCSLPVRAVKPAAVVDACVARATVADAARSKLFDKRPDRKKPLASLGDEQENSVPDVLPRQAKADSRLSDAKPGAFVADADDWAYSNLSREGIDVSHHQGRIDWETVGREAGLSYVYIKATEGANFVDDCYMYNIAMARQYGLKAGSYHYYRPNVSIELQLQNLTSHVHAGDQDLVPMIDIEEDKGVSEEKFIRDIVNFVHMVENYYGKKPLLYTGEYFYNRHFQGLLQEYEWMMARYSPREPILKDGKSYLMWQYSDKGSIPGIHGNVDRSCLMGNGTLKAVKMR